MAKINSDSDVTLGGLKCSVFWGSSKTPLKVTVESADEDASPLFGALVYAVPNQKGGAVVTTLVDHREFKDSAAHLALIIAEKTKTPTFLNCGVSGSPLMHSQVVGTVIKLIENSKHPEDSEDKN